MFIHIAKSAEERDAANALVQKKYSEHGNDVAIPDYSITFVATEVVGTLSLNIDDGQHPLLAESTYKDELDAMRNSGMKLCELARFAFDEGSKQSDLKMLWEFLAGYEHDRTHLIIEVRPRHRRFYQKLFGFVQVASKFNPTMGTNSYLLSKKLEAAEPAAPDND